MFVISVFCGDFRFPVFTGYLRGMTLWFWVVWVCWVFMLLICCVRGFLFLVAALRFHVVGLFVCVCLGFDFDWICFGGLC